MTTNLLIFGRQGSGKGTQSALLTEHYGVPHISTGDILREAVAQGTEFGRQAKVIMDRGDLVSDDIILGIVGERLRQADARDGYLLDGFPRTLTQAEGLDGFSTVDVALNLDVPVEEARQRMLDRGRGDDTDEAIDRRFALYEEETVPVIEYYDRAGKLVTVDGLGEVDDIFERVVKAIESART